MWVDVNACLPIRVTIWGEGPVDDADATEDCQLVCWVCLTPWQCDAYREGRLNVVQLAAIHDFPENPDA